jgi:DNA-binding response OmpR family regulator
VLVVDDEPSFRTICRINLEAAGIQVVEAADGEAALAVIKERCPDLILLDVMMPTLDGWELAAALTATEETRNLPIVFLTARSEPAARARGRELGAVGFITKPFDPLLIAAQVHETLRRIEQGEREQLRREIDENE